MLWRIENGEVDGIKPKVIVLMIGTNNTGSDHADKIAQGVTKIFETARAKTGTKVLLLLGAFARGENSPEGCQAAREDERINEVVQIPPAGRDDRRRSCTTTPA